jgi:hypothetical protein
MNDGPVRLRRAGPLAAALAVTALLAAACSGASSPSDAAGSTTYQKALAYAQCMRAHGEPGYPDPQSNGGFIVNSQKDHLNGALMNSANKTCQHLLPKSAPMTAAQQRQATAKALKFTACMRAHGLPNFPDPTVNASGVSFSIHRVPRPLLQSAQHACQKVLGGS